jgi:tetratricopeptide (TPR) repeat protein
MESISSRFPYFVPTKWMFLQKDFEQVGYSENIRQSSLLFIGNRLNFSQFMHANIAPINSNILQKDALETDLDQEEDLLLADNYINEVNENIQIDGLTDHPATNNYFQFEGIEVSGDIPDIVELDIDSEANEKSLMVMMGFDEWLLFLKKKNEEKKSEEEDKAVLRTMWQKEKLAAAMGEEDDQIPEAVFEMAINSIDKQDILVSESLAEIHIKQGKYEKAIEIYRKLSLQNPEKKTYFAGKINQLNKEN